MPTLLLRFLILFDNINYSEQRRKWPGISTSAHPSCPTTPPSTSTGSSKPHSSQPTPSATSFSTPITSTGDHSPSPTNPTTTVTLQQLSRHHLKQIKTIKRIRQLLQPLRTQRSVDKARLASQWVLYLTQKNVYVHLEPKQLQSQR